MGLAGATSRADRGNHNCAMERRAFGIERGIIGVCWAARRHARIVFCGVKAHIAAAGAPHAGVRLKYCDDLAIWPVCLSQSELPGRACGLFDRLHSRFTWKGLTTMRVTGTVKFFNGAKGYGFITPADGGKDVFVHATALEAAGIRTLNEGDKVTFVLEDDRKGRGKQAGQIQKA
jgi:cold shock protein